MVMEIEQYPWMSMVMKTEEDPWIGVHGDEN